ncbi:MAG: NUDIX domain-containing protein [bacterium]|nr:NUDIX domain-containing protein [bacterium]
MNKDPLMEYVDEKDKVVGCLPRSEIREQKKSYRMIAIFVFNDKGQLLVQKRGPHLKRFPNYYDSSVGGHVDPGESYEEAALREMKEELGIQEPLKLVKKKKITYEEVPKFVSLFKCNTNKKLKIDNHEVKEAMFRDISQIRAMIKEGELFLPVFIEFFYDLYGANNGS